MRYISIIYSLSISTIISMHTNLELGDILSIALQNMSLNLAMEHGRAMTLS